MLWDGANASTTSRVLLTSAFLSAHVLSPAQEADLAAKKASLDLAAMARTIAAIQQRLTQLAAQKTADMKTRETTTLPDPSGIKLAPDFAGKN